MTQCDTASTRVLSKADNLSALWAPWTSKNMFISMTLISLCIKDKCLSLSIPELYLSMSPNKGKGQLIHAKHASSLNFWFPLWALFFLIKRGLLSSPLVEECFWYLPLSLCLWTQCQLPRRVGHDNISFNYSFNVTTILLPFSAIPSQQSIPANGGVTHGPA